MSKIVRLVTAALTTVALSGTAMLVVSAVSGMATPVGIGWD
ncbi:hypothetical protein [Kitasatospora sp. SUK 42]|nr:hypothetical protein [Kitasatospora sp. SUK 42]